MHALLATEDKALCEDAACTEEDSATKQRHDGVTSLSRRSVAVGDQWKRHVPLPHQRVRNWQLCPDSIDKVDKRYCYMSMQ